MRRALSLIAMGLGAAISAWAGSDRPDASAPATSAAPAAPARWAQNLPDARSLARAYALKSETVQVQEPHASQAGRPVLRRYRGFDARAFLDHWLGPGWQDSGGEVEFRARDGFVSRIPVARFVQHTALLAFARVDGKPFQLDVHAQHEKQVPLGPYYLVWRNIGAPDLIAEGGAQWPYQVVRIALRPSSQAALLPAGLPPGHEAAAAAAQTYCLSCHQINGFGGDKMPLNLAVQARQMDAAHWQQWLLQPQSVKPGTAMPPLPETLPPAEREAVVRQLHEYLRALPVTP